MHYFLENTIAYQLGSVFFICFRECLETTVVVSVLLAFLKQSLYESDRPTYKRLVKQVCVTDSPNAIEVHRLKGNRFGWDAA